jgi:hypothetical protein
MPLCERCGQRLAKRHCPALGAGLCALCCGRLRNREVHCPATCVFLVRHKPYQEKRLLEKRTTPPSRDPFAGDDLLKDERLAWLIYQLEAPLAIFGERSAGVTDRDALLALEYARAGIERGKSLIVIPGESLKPKNEIGEAVIRAADTARWEAAVILSSGLETYKKEEKLRCLDRIIRSARVLAGADPGRRTYIGKLVERFAAIRNASRDRSSLIRS